MVDTSQIIGVVLGGFATSTLTIIISQIKIRNKVRQELETYRQELTWMLQEFPLHKHIGTEIYYPQPRK